MPVRADHQVAVVVRIFVQDGEYALGTKQDKVLLVGGTFRRRAKKTAFLFLGGRYVAYPPGGPELIHFLQVDYLCLNFVGNGNYPVRVCRAEYLVCGASGIKE